MRHAAHDYLMPHHKENIAVASGSIPVLASSISSIKLYKTSDEIIDRALQEAREGTIQPTIVNMNTKKGKDIKSIKVKTYIKDAATVLPGNQYQINPLEHVSGRIVAPLATTWAEKAIPIEQNLSIGIDKYDIILQGFGYTGAPEADSSGQIANDAQTTSSVHLENQMIKFDVYKWGLSFDLPYISAEQYAMLFNTQMIESLNQAVRYSYICALNRLVFTGGGFKGGQGIANHSLITNRQVVVNGSGGSPFWANKTFQEIVCDVKTTMQSLMIATKGNYLNNDGAYTILMSQSEYLELTEKFGILLNSNAIPIVPLTDYLRQITLSDRPLEIIAIPDYLTIDPTTHNRILFIYMRDPEALLQANSGFITYPITNYPLKQSVSFVCAMSDVIVRRPQFLAVRDNVGQMV